MPEEILKASLAELMQTVRLKRANGTVLEAKDMEGVRDCCQDIRAVDPHAASLLFQFFNLAEQLCDPKLPVQVEFAIKLK